MIAIVTAGGLAGPGDPLHAEAQGGPKALLDVAGKPMIQWVLDALYGASRVEHVVVIGLPAEAHVRLEARTTRLPDQGGMVGNILAGLRAVRSIDPAASHALLSSGDIPGITPAMVDWRVGTVEAAAADVDYAVVERTTMDRVFPGSRRSFTRLKGTEVCGGDLNGLSLQAGFDAALWDRLVAARKNALKQAAIVGFDVLLLALLGRLTLQAAEQRVGRNLGLKAHVTLCPYAEVGMDVDKPHQLAMLRRHLEGRGAA